MHLLEPKDLSISEISEVICLGRDIIKDSSKYTDIAKGKLLGTLFYEPSTRTRLSFESAMLRLGGGVVGFSDSSSSSVSKGESLADTIRTVGSYVDIIALRHPKEGAPRLAAKYSPVPIINAGDGGHHHPSQTITDLLTIFERKGRLDKLKVAFCGDLKFGRTVHSLTEALLEYSDNFFYFVSPEELRLPDYIREKLSSSSYLEVRDLQEVISDIDILYMTRVQKERFVSEEEYMRLKDSYILDNSKMSLARRDMIVMHPLPRVNEISMEVDRDDRAVYFDQVKYGMYARMALIIKLLGLGDRIERK